VKLGIWIAPAASVRVASTPSSTRRASTVTLRSRVLSVLVKLPKRFSTVPVGSAPAVAAWGVTVLVVRSPVIAPPMSTAIAIEPERIAPLARS
jgi:hypothetical protein